jgi:hypothetical protein
MRKNEHEGRFCKECMHLCDPSGPGGNYTCNPTNERGVMVTIKGVCSEPDYEVPSGEVVQTLPGVPACEEFKESIDAQHVQQLKIANKLKALELEMYADVNEWVPYEGQIKEALQGD